MFSLTEVLSPLEELLDNLPHDMHPLWADLVRKIIEKAFPDLLAHKIAGVQVKSKHSSEFRVDSFLAGRVPVSLIASKLDTRLDFFTMEEIQKNGGDQTAVVNHLVSALVDEIDRKFVEFMHIMVDRFRLPIPIFRSYETGKSLSYLIDNEADKISRDTKHLPGNWCVVDKKMYECLLLELPNFLPSTSTPQGNFNIVGTINNRIDVYLDESKYARANILVGYKNYQTNPNEDASVIYAPFSLIRPDGVRLSHKTFQPELCFDTCDGVQLSTNSLKIIQGRHEA